MKSITYDPSKWVLVPVEPTTSMLHASLKKIDYQPVSWNEGANNLGDVYKAMLSASPTPEDVKPADGGEPCLDIEEIVSAAMQQTWNGICSDTGCHPLDIEKIGRKLHFTPNHWARITGETIARKVKIGQSSGVNYIADDDTFPGTVWFANGRKVKINSDTEGLSYLEVTMERNTEVDQAFYAAHPDRTNDMLLAALKSISKNTCCDNCQEAAKVASKTLKQAEGGR